VTVLFAMNSFTCSGSFRSACWLMCVSALSMNFIVMSALPLFFMSMSMFRMGVCLKWMVFLFFGNDLVENQPVLVTNVSQEFEKSLKTLLHT